MAEYSVEISKPVKDGKTGIEFEKFSVTVIANSHESAYSIAQVRHGNIITSTEVVND